MENRVINVGVIKKVAEALQHLRPTVAFVGGAIISLYVDDPSADEVRPTKDIDLSISLEGYGAWAMLQEEMAKLGFSPDAVSKIICRFTYDDVTVDLMPDDEKILGFSNPWYKPGLANAVDYTLAEDLTIRLLPLPYFIATKFSAFHGRGKSEHRTSHDFEDIIYLTDNVTHIVDTISKGDDTVRSFLRNEYKDITENRYRHEIIACHLPPLVRDGRMPIVERKIREIAAL